MPGTASPRIGVHVAGCAVALGLGAAIAGWGATEASADTGRPDSGSRTATQSAPREAQTGSPTGRTGPTARRTGNERSATTVPRRRAPSVTAARARGDRPAATVSNPAIAPGAQSPAGPRQRRVTILKNTHIGLPPMIDPFVRSVSGSATFTPDTVYDLNDDDQYDWNKLTGIGFSIPANVEATMVAWRWNVQAQTFEVAPAFNVADKRVLPSDDEIIRVPAGDSFAFAVDYAVVTISHGAQTVYKASPPDLKAGGFSFRMWPWFGGNRVSPKTLSFYLGVRSARR